MLVSTQQALDEVSIFRAVQIICTASLFYFPKLCFNVFMLYKKIILSSLCLLWVQSTLFQAPAMAQSAYAEENQEKALQELYDLFPDYDSKGEPVQLKHYLGSSHAEVRLAALKKLDISHPDSLTWLLKLYQDSDAQVRGLAIDGLWQKQGVACLPSLMKQFEKERADNQIKILIYLQQKPDEADLDILIKNWLYFTENTDKNQDFSYSGNILYDFNDANLSFFRKVSAKVVSQHLTEALKTQPKKYSYQLLRWLFDYDSSIANDILNTWLEKTKVIEKQLSIIEKLNRTYYYPKSELYVKVLLEGTFNPHYAGKFPNVQEHLRSTLEYLSFDESIRKSVEKSLLVYLQKPSSKKFILDALRFVSSDSLLIPELIQIAKTGTSLDKQAAFKLLIDINSVEVYELKKEYLQNTDLNNLKFVLPLLAKDPLFSKDLQALISLFLNSDQIEQKKLAISNLTAMKYPQAGSILLNYCQQSQEPDIQDVACDSLFQGLNQDSEIEVFQAIQVWVFQQIKKSQTTRQTMFDKLIDSSANTSKFLEPFFLEEGDIYFEKLMEIWDNRGWSLPDSLGQRLDLNSPNLEGTLEALEYHTALIRSKMLNNKIKALLFSNIPQTQWESALKIWVKLTYIHDQEKLQVLESLSTKVDAQKRNLLSSAIFQLDQSKQLLDWQNKIKSQSITYDDVLSLANLKLLNPEIGIAVLEADLIQDEESHRIVYNWLLNRDTPRTRQEVIALLPKLSNLSLITAIQVLADWGEKAATQQISQFLNSADQEIQSHSLLNLSKLQAGHLETTIESFLKSEDPQLVFAALDSLIFLKYSFALEPLMFRLMRLPTQYQTKVASVIQQHGTPAQFSDWVHSVLAKNQVEFDDSIAKDNLKSQLFNLANKDVFSSIYEWSGISEYLPNKTGTIDCVSDFATLSLMANPANLEVLSQSSDLKESQIFAVINSYWPNYKWRELLENKLILEQNPETRFLFLISLLVAGSEQSEKELLEQLTKTTKFSFSEKNLVNFLLLYGSSSTKSKLAQLVLKDPLSNANGYIWQQMLVYNIQEFESVLQELAQYSLKEVRTKAQLQLQGNVLCACKRTQEELEQEFQENLQKALNILSSMSDQGKDVFESNIGKPELEEMIQIWLGKMPTQEEEWDDYYVQKNLEDILIKSSFDPLHPELEKLAQSLPLYQAADIRELQYQLFLKRNQVQPALDWLQSIKESPEISSAPSRQLWLELELLQTLSNQDQINLLKKLIQLVNTQFTTRDWTQNHYVLTELFLRLGFIQLNQGQIKAAKESILASQFELKKVTEDQLKFKQYLFLQHLIFGQIALQENDFQQAEQDFLMSLYLKTWLFEDVIKLAESLKISISGQVGDLRQNLLNAVKAQNNPDKLNYYTRLFEQFDQNSKKVESQYLPCLPELGPPTTTNK